MINKSNMKYKKIDILFLISFILVAFAVVNVSNLLSKIQQEQLTKEKFHHTITYELLSATNHLKENDEESGQYESNTNTEINFSLENLYQAVKDAPGNVVLHNWTYVGESLQWYNIKIIFTEHEILEKHPWEPNSKLITSESIAELLSVEHNGKKYLTILGHNVKIDDVVVNKTASNYDEQIYIYYENLDEETKKILEDDIEKRINMGAVFDLIVEGDSSLTQTCQNLEKYAENNLLELKLQTFEEPVNPINSLYLSANIIFTVVLLAFTIANCICTSYLWMKHNEHQLMIRRAFGYTRTKLVKYVLKVFLRFGGIAFIITFVFQMCYELLSNNTIEINGSLIYKFGCTVLFMLAIAFVVLLFQIKKLLSRNISVMIRDI